MRRAFIAGLVLLGLAFTVWTSVTQVESGERGVVLRFGRIIDTVGPGLHVGLPWGIDRVMRVNVDGRRQVTIGLQAAEDVDDIDVVIPTGQLLTGDHNLVNFRVKLEYSVNAAEVEQFAIYENQADAIVGRTAEAVLAEWVAGKGVDEVLLRSQELLPRWLAAETQRRLDPYNLGVSIKYVSLDQPHPPLHVKHAFDAVNRAQAQIETEESSARQAANESWTRALSHKFNLEKMTPVHVAGVKRLAEVEATAFLRRLAMLAQVRAADPYYLAALWWDEMTSLYAAMRAADRLDLLDNRLAGGGIDIIQQPPAPKKK